MLKFIPVLAVAFCGCSQAQSLRMFNTGILQCGIVRRDVTKIQVYCYKSGELPLPLLYNSIQELKAPITPTEYPSLIVTYQYGTDGFAISFRLEAGFIYYDIVTTTNREIKGVIVDMLGSIKLGCGLPMGVYRYTFSNNVSCTDNWISAWAWTFGTNGSM